MGFSRHILCKVWHLVILPCIWWFLYNSWYSVLPICKLGCDKYTFSFQKGDESNTENIKISKGEESNFIWCIQKLNNLMKSDDNLDVYQKQVVFIFDECHRSQFGEAQKNLKKKFKKFYQFGFTGTPIFPENACGSETTASVFGRLLHSYVITDAIRDEKVLKFKVDYNDVRPKFKKIENEQDEAKLTAAENKKAFLHPERIREITQYILNNFSKKTHRYQIGAKGFNAMFAVSSVDAAKLYYLMNKFKICKKLQSYQKELFRIISQHIMISAIGNANKE